jgi:ssRNA-specific RNase YbeY (16S rRNA maturation enzyme)
MRESLWAKIFLVGTTSVTWACGDLTERQHIEDTTLSSQQNAVDGSPFHSLNGWQSAVAFYVEERAPDHVIESSMFAAESWNDAVGYPVLDFKGVIDSERGETLYASLDDDDTVLYYEDRWISTTDKPTTTLATTVWENEGSSDRIVRGDVILNAEIYLFQDSTQEPLDVEREDVVVDAETVILHEFGHLLGLDHVAEEVDPESVMHARTYIGRFMHSRLPSDGDRQNIKEIYP